MAITFWQCPNEDCKRYYTTQTTCRYCPTPTETPKKQVNSVSNNLLGTEPDKKRIIRFTIHGQPRPKQRPRMGKGYAYTPKATKQYEALVQSASSLSISKPFTEPIFVHIAFYRQKGYKTDVDNLAKAVLDGMEKIAYKNDNLVRKLFVELEYYSDKPRTEVTITDVQNWTMVLETLAAKELAA